MHMKMDELLLFTQRNKASDLHLSSNKPPSLRVNGEIILENQPPLTAESVRELLYSIMTEQQRAEFERELELDFAIVSGNTMRFRVNAFHTLHGPAAVMRAI